MSRPVRLDPEAAEELEAAWRWYEERRAGLGSAFLAAVEDAMRRLEGPTVSLSVAGVSERLRVRRVLVQTFPYSLVFIDLPAERRVLYRARATKAWILPGETPPT